MDIREKLVELLTDNLPRIGNLPKCDNPLQYTMDEIVERIADHLIAHGITVQEWISVDDKYPPYNRDVLVYRPNMAMKILVDSYDGYYGDDDDEWYEGWALYGKDKHGNPAITHWAYLPQPPKGRK